MSNTEEKLETEAIKNAKKLKVSSTKFFQSWHLWMVIIGLALFIVVASFCLLIAHKSSLVSLAISTIVTIIYAFIFGAVLLFSYLVRKKVAKKLSKQAEGVLSVGSVYKGKKKRLEFKLYLRRKLHVHRFLPLSLQNSLRLKSVYLAVSYDGSIANELEKLGWQRLDNPEKFLTQVFVRKNQAIILLGNNDYERKYCLLWLKRYTKFTPLSGILCLVDVVSMQSAGASDHKKKLIVKQLEKIHRTSTFSCYKPVIWVLGMSSIHGIEETERLLHRDKITSKDKLSQLIDYLHHYSLESMYSYPSSKSNARAHLLLESLINIKQQLGRDKIGELTSNDIVLCWNDRANDLSKQLYQLPRLRLTWRYSFSLFGTVLCASALLILFQKSFFCQHNYMSLLNRQVMHPSRLTIEESKHLLLPPPALQVFPFSKKENQLNLTVLIAKNGKKFTQSLQLELYGLLQHSVKSDNHKIDQGLRAYLMLNSPADYSSQVMLAWLKANRNRASVSKFLSPTSRRILLALNDTNFAALPLKNVSFFPAKKAGQWRITFNERNNILHYDLITTEDTSQLLQNIFNKEGKQ